MATVIPTPGKGALHLCNYPGLFFLCPTLCLKGSPSVTIGTINFGSLLWGVWKLKLSLLDYAF